MKDENKSSVLVKKTTVKKFVRDIHQDVCLSYGNIPLEQVAGLILPGMKYLSPQQKNILIGLLKWDLSEQEIAEKYRISRATLRTLRKRSKKRLKLFIFSYLEAEKLISEIKRMQFSRR